MLIRFDRPIGAKADLAELFYISALMQTDTTMDERGYMGLRKDGSITANDLSAYLISRHGVQISTEKLTEVLINDHVYSHEDRFDLVQLVALLFIPQLCKLAMHMDDTESEIRCNNNSQHGNQTLIDKTLKMIIHDTFLQYTYEESGDENVSLTKDLVRDILLCYGENDMAADDKLLEEMVDAARNQSVSSDNKEVDDDDDDDDDHDNEANATISFDSASFLRALTSDVVKYYDIRNETKLSSNFDDAFDECACRNDDDASRVFNYDVKRTTHITGPHVAGGKIIGEEVEIAHKVEPFRFVNTLQGIDYIASTYLCKYTVISVWVSGYFLYIGYFNPFILSYWQEKSHPSCDNDYEPLASFYRNGMEFKCDVAKSIIDWFVVYVALAGLGTIFVLIGSMGYESKGIDKRFPLVISTIIMTVVLGYLPIIMREYCLSTKYRSLCYIQFVAAIALSMTVYLRWVRIINIFDGGLCFTWRSPSLRKESKLKQAAAKKIMLMQQNALSIHQNLADDKIIATHFSQGLSYFAKIDNRFERVGNLSWGINQIFGETRNYEDDGIWLSARFLAAVVCQWLAVIAILILGITISTTLYNEWQPEEDMGLLVSRGLTDFISSLTDSDIINNVTDQAVDQVMDVTSNFVEVVEGAGVLKFDCLAISSFLVARCSHGITSASQDIICSVFSNNADDLCATLEPLFRPLEFSADERLEGARDIFNSTMLYDKFYDLIFDATYDNALAFLGKWYPRERYMVLIPALVGTIFAVFASLATTVFVIPNTKTTILKLRSGVIATFFDPDVFTDRRFEVIEIAKLSGVMFWGNMLGSLTIGAICASFLFLCLWQVTAFIAQYLLALFIGASLMIVFRWLVLSRPAQMFVWKALYRSHPATANIVNVSNECVNIALYFFVVPVRLLNCFLLSALYVGRVDVSFMSPGVDRPIEELFSFRLPQIDPYHNYFLTSLLTSEAHRHPYIETIGLMTLLKLRHKSEFVNRAGCCWRLVFVLALMPWLRKQRLLTYEFVGNARMMDMMPSASVSKYLGAS